jgi:Baseplate J-like protein
MAKSADQVAASISLSVQSADVSVDVTKGPYFDTVIRPPSVEIAVIGSEVERVGTLYSRMVDQSNSLNATEIDALGRAFGVVQPSGTRAKVLVLFTANAKPSTEIVISAGTPVSTQDGQYVFTTISTMRGIDSTTISAYFDANSGKYLIPVQAVAVAEGTNYNLSAYRINRLLTTIPGIAGVYNPVSSAGGVSPYTSSDYLSEIQASFYGRDTGSLSGLAVEIKRRGISSTLLFVDPSERDAFFRPATSSALDVYLSDQEETAADEIFAANGRSSIMLTNQPVLGVDAVYINGKLLSTSAWSVSYDTSTAYGRSTRARTAVTFSMTSTSDSIRIQYRYAGSVVRLQESLDQQDIMGCDLLPRIPRALLININAEVSCPADLLAAVKSSLQYYVARPFIDVIDPKDTYQYLRSSYSELRQLKWNTFDRLNGTTVGPIKVGPGLQPVFKNAADLSVTIARS